MSLILKEIESFQKLQKQGKKIPIPNYFFIERYGRSEDAAVEDIAKALGQSQGFVFSTGKQYHEKGLLRNFQMACEQHADTGRAYEGFVMIEWDGALEDKDIYELVEYLQGMHDSIHVLFTMKESADRDFMEKILRQYFFLKTLEGEAYTVDEQLDILKDEAKQYGFEISDDAQKYASEELAGINWDAEKDVKLALGSMMKELIYDKMLHTEQVEDETTVNEADMKEAIEKLDCKVGLKGRIGFYMD